MTKFNSITQGSGVDPARNSGKHNEIQKVSQALSSMTSPGGSHSPVSSDGHTTGPDDYLSDESTGPTDRKTIQDEVPYIAPKSGLGVKRPSHSRLNQDFYSYWPQNKKSHFDRKYKVEIVKNNIESARSLRAIQKIILKCLEGVSDVSDKQNILLALNEQCSERSLGNIYKAFNDIDSVKSLTSKVFEAHDVNTLKIADLRKGSEITLTSKKGRTATWEVTGKSGENVTLSKKSGSSRKNTKTKSQAELWSTASNYKEKEGEMVIKGKSIPLSKTSKFKMGEDTFYDVPLGSVHIDVDKQSLGRLGMSKSRSVDGVSITRGEDLKQQKIASGTFKKVVEGSDSKDQYAVKKSSIRYWTELIDSIIESNLEGTKLYSYDGEKRNVISAELKATPLNHGDMHTKSIEEKRTFIKDSWQGLRELHRQGIIHNDFKIPNTVQEKDKSYRIIDFGLSFGAGQVKLQEANLDKVQVGGTFRPQTFIHEESVKERGKTVSFSGTNITQFDQLTPKAKESIDLWAFVMSTLETVGIFTFGSPIDYPDDLRTYSGDIKVCQKEGFRTAESLLRDVKTLNRRKDNPLNQIAPRLGSKIEAFLTLSYNEKGEVTKDDGTALNSSGQYDIPNEHWDFDSWEGVLSQIRRR